MTPCQLPTCPPACDTPENVPEPPLAFPSPLSPSGPHMDAVGASALGACVGYTPCALWDLCQLLFSLMFAWPFFCCCWIAMMYNLIIYLQRGAKTSAENTTNPNLLTIRFQRTAAAPGNAPGAGSPGSQSRTMETRQKRSPHDEALVCTWTCSGGRGDQPVRLDGARIVVLARNAHNCAMKKKKSNKRRQESNSGCCRHQRCSPRFLGEQQA